MANGRSYLLPATAVRRFTTYKHVIDIKLTIIQSVEKKYIYIYILQGIFFLFFFFIFFFIFFFFILEKKDRTVIKV